MRVCGATGKSLHDQQNENEVKTNVTWHVFGPPFAKIKKS